VIKGIQRFCPILPNVPGPSTSSSMMAVTAWKTYGPHS
jgi:hypothetical protein